MLRQEKKLKTNKAMIEVEKKAYGPLFVTTALYEHSDVQLYEYDRLAHAMCWGIVKGLMDAGYTQEQAEEILMSKWTRHMLDWQMQELEDAARRWAYRLSEQAPAYMEP